MRRNNKIEPAGKWLLSQCEGMTRNQIAEIVDMDPANLNKLLNGSYCFTFRKAVQVCQPLNICPYDLLYRQVDYHLHLMGVKKQ